MEADGQAAAAAEEVLRGHPAAGEVQVRRHAAEDDGPQKGAALLKRLLLVGMTDKTSLIDESIERYMLEFSPHLELG